VPRAPSRINPPIVVLTLGEAAMYIYIVERTQIYLSREEAAALDREARRRGQTRSHLIREAIDRAYLSEPSVEDVLATLEATAGAWVDHPESGEEYVERIRAGDRLKELWGDRWTEPSDV
jgi:predicted DNA-binding protein